MNWRRVFFVMRHDLRLVLTNKAVVISMIVTGGTFMILMPIGAALGFGGLREADPEVAMRLLSQFGDNIFESLPNTSPQNQMIYLVLAQLVAPLFLMQPVMLTSVIAADSFAGERERKTLEYLLHSPATEKELLYGKMLAAWIPSFLLATLGPLPYLAVANHVLEPIVGPFALPNTTWLTLMFWVTPGAAALALGLSVLISARVESFQAAYQSGPVVLMPFIGLMVGQFLGGVFLDTKMLAIVGAVLWVSSAIIITIGHRSFSRMQLLLGGMRRRTTKTAVEPVLA